MTDKMRELMPACPKAGPDCRVTRCSIGANYNYSCTVHGSFHTQMIFVERPNVTKLDPHNPMNQSNFLSVMGPYRCLRCNNYGTDAAKTISAQQDDLTNHLNSFHPGWQIETPKKAEEINHPDHYNMGGIEVIDAIEAWKLNFNLGNAVKYISRADTKGMKEKDLRKAIWYIQRELGENRKNDSSRVLETETTRGDRGPETGVPSEATEKPNDGRWHTPKAHS